MAEIFATAVTGFGYEVVTRSYFDTVTIHAPGRAHALYAKAKEKRINLRFVDADHLGVAFDQRRCAARTGAPADRSSAPALERISIDAVDAKVKETILETLLRTELPHAPGVLDVSFENPRCCATRHLQVKDVALDQAMIPLCPAILRSPTPRRR
ncbi:MAG: hypothetical protein U1E16_04720 [Hyphomicrobiales bacterium]